MVNTYILYDFKNMTSKMFVFNMTHILKTLKGDFKRS